MTDVIFCFLLASERLPRRKGHHLLKTTTSDAEMEEDPASHARVRGGSSAHRPTTTPVDESSHHLYTPQTQLCSTDTESICLPQPDREPPTGPRQTFLYRYKRQVSKHKTDRHSLCRLNRQVSIYKTDRHLSKLGTHPRRDGGLPRSARQAAGLRHDHAQTPQVMRAEASLRACGLPARVKKAVADRRRCRKRRYHEP